MAEKDRKGPPIDGKQGDTPAVTPEPSEKVHESERQGGALEETFPANDPVSLFIPARCPIA